MKKVLLSLLTIAVVGSLITGGVMAWFSDTETSQNNTFTAGTLDMTIQDSDEGPRNNPVNASWTSPADWAPGDTFTTGKIRLENVGSIDINYLFITYYNYSWTGDANLGNVIEVVEYWEYVPGTTGWFNNIGTPQSLENQMGNQDGTLTLYELVDADWVGDTTWIDYCTGMAYDAGTTGPAIIVGGTYQTYLVLKFMESAGNEYQGASCSFDIDFEGVQDNVAQKH